MTLHLYDQVGRELWILRLVVKSAAKRELSSRPVS